MTNFTSDQIAAAALAAETAKLIVLQQWMNREDAAKAEEQIAELRRRQLEIETKIELGM
jgi:predicted GIY-YIG superfamily endonuclease